MEKYVAWISIMLLGCLCIKALGEEKGKLYGKVSSSQIRPYGRSRVLEKECYLRLMKEEF